MRVVAHDDRPARIGIVFQNFALFDEWNARDNVQFAIDHRTDRSCEPVKSAAEWLDELRVDPAARPSTMSGGQKQRLAIARTLAAQPNVVLYDEPTSGLDRATGHEVAALIATTHRTHSQTSIVVTHDYDTLLRIADHCLLLDSASQTLRKIPKTQWPTIESELKPVAARAVKPIAASLKTNVIAIGDEFVRGLGHAVRALGGIVTVPVQIATSAFSWAWAWRFFVHTMRLIGGPSSWGYLAMAGGIIGFTATYFTFRFLPFQSYSKPLLIEDLLGSIGFAMYRILVPVLSTVLIAARCGAAMAADVGVKRYGSQVDAIRTLGCSPAGYLALPAMIAFLVATPLLNWIAFEVARVVSLVCFVATHPEYGPQFWQMHFYRNLDDGNGWWFRGSAWVLAKTLLCGVGIAAISYDRGMIAKESAGDVSRCITSTVLWSTLYVLVVHFVIALIEF